MAIFFPVISIVYELIFTLFSIVSNFHNMSTLTHPKTFQNFFIEWTTFDPTTLKATFQYSFDHEEYFTEVIDFSCEGFEVRKDLDWEIIKNLLFHTSIALGISYYKLCPSAQIIVTTGKLETPQKAFWKKFYLQWLGEYLFRNNILPEWIGVFESMSDEIFRKIPFSLWEKLLVPIGGGKDSIVSTGMLDEQWDDYDLFTFGKYYILHDAVARVSGHRHLVVKRTLDPYLFELNALGYPNGHVPITGIIAFVLQIVNYLYGYRMDVLSNEKSADEGNVLWHGIDVNHQYSKSREFEEDFRAYSEAYMSDTEYKSILRDLYEIEIAERFAKMRAYFPVFSSCNNNFKVIESNKTTSDRWCLQCPKCVFVFAILRPYITHEDVITIFGRDLYEDISLIPLYEELLGQSGHKPFECVGTHDEVILSLQRAVEKYREERRGIPEVLWVLKKWYS